MPYSLPPWLQPADTTRDYLSGLQLGANIAHQSQALQEARERTAIEAQTRQQELERRMAEETQRLMQQKAYHDELISLREQQLQNESQRVQATTQALAQKSLAQQEYQKRVASGEDPAKVMMELGPGMGMSGLPSMFGRRPPMKPGPVEAFPVTMGGEKIPGVFSVPTSTGGMRTMDLPGYKPPGFSTSQQNAAAHYLQVRRKELSDSIIGRPDAAKNKPILDQISTIDQQITQLLPALRTGQAPDGGPQVHEMKKNPKTGRWEVAAPVKNEEVATQDETGDDDGTEYE